jgi:hypothetical protein
MTFKIKVFCFIGFAVFSIVAYAADVCYEDDQVSCEELVGQLGASCDSSNCFLVVLFGEPQWFCANAEEEISQVMVNVANHTSVGLDSLATGESLYCKRERSCKEQCDPPAEGEGPRPCESASGDWAYSYPYAHTYAVGNYCDVY